MEKETLKPCRLLKTKDAACYLAISERTLWNLYQEGKIAAVKMNRLVRFTLEDLDAFIKQHKTLTSDNSVSEQETVRHFPDQCKNCRYWFPRETQDKTGYCRRFPPAFMHYYPEVQLIDYYFYTGQEDWCGEYKPR